MASYNRVIIMGNLTRDPDYKQLASGQPVCRLGLASNRQFKNRQTGAMVQEVCFVDIDVWGAQAESCNQYLQKGRAILVEGRLKFDTWEDPNGQTRSKHSIVADRVVFLSQQNSDVAFDNKSETTNVNSVRRSQESELEKGLLDQIDQIKSRTQAKAQKAAEKVEAIEPAKEVVADETKKIAKPVQEATSVTGDAAPVTSATGEIEFKDTPPFQDDLPF